MKFVSAGHNATKGPTHDPGAPGVNGRWEAIEMVKLRDRVIAILKEKGYTDIVHDMDGESLGQYLRRIKPGNGSMVVEFHMNAGVSSATGTETLVEVDADKMDIACAKEFSAHTSKTLNIPLRGNFQGATGVKSEADTRHKRLALMKEEGIIVLVEVCFISNQEDMRKYDANFEALCQGYADIIIKYDALIN